MTSTDLAKTNAFGSLKLADWPEIDRLLLQEARKPKIFLRAGGAASAALGRVSIRVMGAAGGAGASPAASAA